MYHISWKLIIIVILSNNLVESIINDLNPSLESVNYIKYGLNKMMIVENIEFNILYLNGCSSD